MIAGRRRAGDRLILLALRQHDLEPENPRGAFPSSRRLAALTGLRPGYVRNRLAAMQKASVLTAERHRGGTSHYFIVPPVTFRGDSRGTSGGDNPLPEPVTARDDRVVTELSPPAGAQKEKEKSKPTRALRGTTWLTPYFDAWVAAYGGKPHAGPLAKFLKPLQDEHGPEKVLAHWLNYLMSTEARFNPTPSKFASTFGTWGSPRPNGKRESAATLDDQTPAYDADGRPAAWLSAEGARVYQ